MKWINAFLCFRQQRVVVNGVKSDWAPVVSGVPQGTVLGPLLFSLHINDIMSDIESEIRLFADDCVCYREIKDIEDTLKLQKDIDRLGIWGRNQHSLVFQIPTASIDANLKSFFPQTIRDWNVLPDSLISSTELSDDCVSKFTSLVRARD